MSEEYSKTPQKPDCPLIGANGNIFNLIGIASKTLKENDMSAQAREMRDRIYQCHSYDSALSIIGEYVNATSVEQKAHPTLYGYAASSQQVLNSVKEVAKFIYNQGLEGDVLITTEDGKPFISTFGIFINKIEDMDYRTELLKELVPLQMGEPPDMEEMKL